MRFDRLGGIGQQLLGFEAQKLQIIGPRIRSGSKPPAAACAFQSISHLGLPAEVLVNRCQHTMGVAEIRIRFDGSFEMRFRRLPLPGVQSDARQTQVDIGIVGGKLQQEPVVRHRLLDVAGLEMSIGKLEPHW